MHALAEVVQQREPVNVAGGVDRDGLLRWANDRFRTDLKADDFKNRHRSEIESVLRERSSRYLNKTDDVAARIDEYLVRAYGEQNGQDRNGDGENHAAGAAGDGGGVMVVWMPNLSTDS